MMPLWFTYAVVIGLGAASGGYLINVAVSAFRKSK